MAISTNLSLKNGVYIVKALMKSLGLKDYQAAGFAGTWMCESMCNPGAYNKAEKAGTFAGSSANGSGYGAGLALWSKSWKQSILKKMGRYTPIENWTMDLQLEIVIKLCSSSYINLLKSLTTVAGAVDIVLRGYENGGCGSSTALRSKLSMKAYTWCKTSYIADVGKKTFSDGYVGALTARTSWANKILKLMGSSAYSDLSGIGSMSFGDGSSDLSDGGGTTGGQTYSYPVHDEYTTYTGTGGNIFSNAGDNAFSQAAFSTNTLDASTNKHTRIYSTNDSCIVLDELRLPMDSSDVTYANLGVTDEDVLKHNNAIKALDTSGGTSNVSNASTNNSNNTVKK